MLIKYLAASSGFLFTITAVLIYAPSLLPHKYWNDFAQIEIYLYFAILFSISFYILIAFLLYHVIFWEREHWTPKTTRIFFWLSAAATGFSIPALLLLLGFSLLISFVVGLIEIFNLLMFKRVSSLVK